MVDNVRHIFAFMSLCCVYRKKRGLKGSDRVANEQNLRPGEYKLTLEEQKKGGLKSAEIRKEKATFKKAIQWLVNSDIKLNEGTITDNFKKAGLDISNLNPTQLATIGLWFGAVQGNSTNYRTLMEANEELQEATLNIKEPILNITINNDDKLKETFYEEEEQE